MNHGIDPLHVAIDGPAGSGKSSVARDVAQRLGLTHVDTGAMYRALTWTALREDIAPGDGSALAERLDRLELDWTSGRLRVDGSELDREIRSVEVDAAVSEVSAHEPVRRAMQRRQREISWQCEGGVVMEGRDIGAEVLPLARCKIFLTASVEERARRRALQAGRGDDPETIARVIAELRERDRKDSERPVSPLRMAIDAHRVDNTTSSREETVRRICALAEAARPEASTVDRIGADRYHLRRYAIAHPFARWLFSTLLRIEVHGREHENLAGGVVYACNHISEWDPPLFGASIGRQVAFLAKKELFKGPFGAFIRAFGNVPIDRGRYDEAAFAETLAVLARRGAVAIFPEGTRKPVGRPGPVKRGLGILTIESGCPYLPCYIRGTRHVRAAFLRRYPIEVWIGPPTYLHGLQALRDEGLEDAALQARVGDLYLAQIRALAHRAAHFRPRPDGA